MDEVVEEYEELIENPEQTVRGALNNLDSMIEYFEQLHISLRRLLEVNSKIDNIGVN